MEDDTYDIKNKAGGQDVVAEEKEGEENAQRIRFIKMEQCRDWRW